MSSSKSPIALYLAGPFFNPEQIELIGLLEEQIDSRAFQLYTPRIQSPSAQFTESDRKDWNKWQGVLDWNIRAISKADMVIAVLDYLLPPGQTMQIIQNLVPKQHILSIPDAGTIWELGYAYASGKICIGFYSNAPKQMNLMLSHSLQGAIVGLEAMNRFLDQPADLVRSDHISDFHPYLDQFASWRNVSWYHAQRCWDQFSWGEMLKWQANRPSII